jgi:hypothetical protein
MSSAPSPLSDLQVRNLRLFEFRLESTSAAVEALRRQGRDLEDKHADLVTNRSRLDEERKGRVFPARRIGNSVARMNVSLERWSKREC